MIILLNLKHIVCSLSQRPTQQTAETQREVGGKDHRDVSAA